MVLERFRRSGCIVDPTIKRPSTSSYRGGLSRNLARRFLFASSCLVYSCIQATPVMPCGALYV